MNNIIIMGLPASGKGTLCAQLVEAFGFEHISTGQILRNEQAAGTKLGNMATRIIDAGHYMPDDIMIPMVKNAIIESKNDVGVLLDGFPRTKDQAKYLHAFMLQRKQPISTVIFLDVDQQVAVERIMNRAQKEGRPDDTKEAIVNRQSEYRNKTLPVLDFFSKMGLIKQFSGNGTPDEVFAEVSPFISGIINHGK